MPTSHHKSAKVTITVAETFGLIIIALLILALTLIRFARTLPWHVQ